MPDQLPLQQRIELAEAYCELVWAKHQAIPPGRGYDTQRKADHERAKHIDAINWMLERMLPMYDARRLELETERAS